MNKRKVITNIILCWILIVLVVLVVILYSKEAKRVAKKEAENVTLTEIGYGSQVQQLGYTNAEGLLMAFVTAYNEHNGEGVAQIMDLVPAYIFNEEAESDINKFDEKYVEILSNPNEYEDLVIMQYSLQQQEESIIAFVDETNVTLSVENHSEIKDVTKYISKMTANIRTYSEIDSIDQTDSLEFLLIHKDKAYYIFDYYLIDEKGNKLEGQ